MRKNLLQQCSQSRANKKLDELALTDEQIQSIQVQTLLFNGLNDQVIPIADTSYRLIELLPHAEGHVFNECGHWTQIEKTEPFVKHILQHLLNNKNKKHTNISSTNQRSWFVLFFL